MAAGLARLSWLIGVTVEEDGGERELESESESAGRRWAEVAGMCRDAREVVEGVMRRKGGEEGTLCVFELRPVKGGETSSTGSGRSLGNLTEFWGRLGQANPQAVGLLWPPSLNDRFRCMQSAEVWCSGLPASVKTVYLFDMSKKMVVLDTNGISQNEISGGPWYGRTLVFVDREPNPIDDPHRRWLPDGSVVEEPFIEEEVNLFIKGEVNRLKTMLRVGRLSFVS